MTLAQILLMQIEWLVANVTPVGSPARAEHGILGMILDFFGQSSSFLWSGSHFVMYFWGGFWPFLANSGQIFGRGDTL